MVKDNQNKKENKIKLLLKNQPLKEPQLLNKNQLKRKDKPEEEDQEKVNNNDLKYDRIVSI
jgi:hypothetical protein